MEQTKIREQVIDDLKQYPELKKKVILLRYEQEHPAKISDSEVIDSMALSRPVSDGIRPAGFISDKTMRICHTVPGQERPTQPRNHYGDRPGALYR